MDHLKPEKDKKRLRWIKWVVLFLLLAIVASALTFVVWNWRNASGASQKLFGSSNVMDVIFSSAPEDTAGRVNILIAGNTLDEPDHAGGDLTDSIQILSLDKTTKTGYMVSLPRDLYVNIPGRGQAKINEAYQVGELTDFSEPGYPDGGVGLLQKVASDILGIEIHYYVSIDSTATREIVDALDGVEVTIKSEDPRGLYDPNFGPRHNGPLKLSNGTHVLDGMTALKLTRARGATYGSYGFPRSDFNRAQNQQLVFSAIKKELTLGLLLNPRDNKPVLDAIAENVTTDIRLSEALPLYRLMSEVPSKDLRTISLHDIKNENLFTGYVTPLGQSAVIPAAGINQYDAIQAAIDRLNR